MTVDEIYEFVKMVSNEVQKGNVSPEKFNTALQGAESFFLSSIVGPKEHYGQGIPVPRWGHEATLRMSESIRKLKKTARLNADASGKITYPADYYLFSSLTLMAGALGEKKVEEIKDDEWGERLDSTILPAESYPVCNLKASYIEARPVSNAYRLHYIRKPIAPTWGYTLDGNNRPVYDPATTVESEFPELVHPEIIVKTLEFLGIHLKDEYLMQYAQLKQNIGP